MSKLFSTLRNRELLKIFMVPLVGNSTASMTWAISVLYALDLKATIFQINLITTIWGTMGILLQVPFGILSDKFGRKRMLLIPQIMSLLGTMLRALATEPNHLIIASIVGGFAGGSFFPILITIVGDIATPRERNEAIGTFYFFSSVGMLMGPTVASIILTLPFIQLRTIYQIDSVFQSFIVLYILLMVKESKKPSMTVSYRSVVVDLLKKRGMIAIIIMAVFYFLFSGIMNTYVPIYAREEVGLTDSLIASFSSYRSFAIMLIRFSCITILAKLNVKHFLISTLALGGVVGLSVPYLSSYPALALIMFSYGISFGAVMLLGSTVVAEISTPSNRGIANSVNSLAQSFGTITQMMTIPIVETVGLLPIFTLGGALPLLATIPITILLV